MLQDEAQRTPSREWHCRKTDATAVHPTVYHTALSKHAACSEGSTGGVQLSVSHAVQSTKQHTPSAEHAAGAFNDMTPTRSHPCQPGSLRT